MSTTNHPAPLHRTAPAAPDRVTTIISCPGLRPMAAHESRKDRVAGANENHWFDRVGFRRHWYANIAATVFVLLLLAGGVWVVSEFVRLQKLEACFEAGGKNCMPLDMSRKGQAPR